MAALKFKREGLRAGYPDLGLDMARGEYHGLRIEMKRRKGGVVSIEQLAWHNLLRKQGYAVRVCKGADDAIQALEWYLAL